MDSVRRSGCCFRRSLVRRSSSTSGISVMARITRPATGISSRNALMLSSCSTLPSVVDGYGADAVFGSRMMREYEELLKDSMPLHRKVGKRILTIFENWALGMNLTEFHSGYALTVCRRCARLDPLILPAIHLGTQKTLTNHFLNTVFIAAHVRETRRSLYNAHINEKQT
jgi:hypothetical protein